MGAEDKDLSMLADAIGEMRARALKDTAELAAESVAKIISQEFSEGKDPYGVPWAPLKASTTRRGKRQPPPLTDTGAMKRGVAVRPQPSSLSIDIPAPYASFHQTGTRTLPQRQMLPVQGLPDSWDKALEAAAEEAISKTLKGAE